MLAISDNRAFQKSANNTTGRDGICRIIRHDGSSIQTFFDLRVHSRGNNTTTPTETSNT